MSDTQLIKDKIDVVDLINEYVTLKPGGVNHKGLCPFHQEKSPSFMVNRERQMWKCFGCGKHGDVFTFIEEIEGMEFVEALRYLADKAGVTLTNTRSDVQSSLKNRLKDVNAAAARFFHQVLKQMDVAKPAQEYLRKRGLSDNIIDDWQIGFVPDQWELLTSYLLKKGHSIDDLVASGLTIKREGADHSSGRGFYDRFRGRIMFPIRDVHGAVVGFTGRILVETERSGGKYINTPQTPVYDKSRIIFGLDKAKQEIKAKDMVVMVEGQTDVIAAHQAGMTNVVATSGTALTEHQVTLLQRYTKHMRIAFDADAAGQAAAKRGIDIAMSKGMHLRVIQIPDGAGEDPDSCIKKDPQVWFSAVENAVDIMQWYFARAFAGKDIASPRDKQTIADTVLPEIARIPYAVERDHWLRELAGRLQIDAQILREDLVRIVKELEKKQPAAAKQDDQVQTEKASAEPQDTVFDTLVDSFLALAFVEPRILAKDEPSDLDNVLGAHPRGPLYEAMKSLYTTAHSLDGDALRSSVPAYDEQIGLLSMKGELDFSGISDKEAVAQGKQLAQRIIKHWKQEQRKQLQEQLAVAEQAGDQDKIAALLKQAQELRD